MSILAVIPARGGSKGIPGKNLKELGGKPLVVWMTEAALSVPAVGGVIVSTDDEQIRDVIVEYRRQNKDILGGYHRLSPHPRPPEISGDTASSESAVLDVLGKWPLGVPDTILMLQPTSPLTLSEDIEGVLEALDAPAGMHTPLKFDSAFSVTPFDKFLWHDMGVAKGVVGINHEKTQPREMRQQRHGERCHLRDADRSISEGKESVLWLLQHLRDAKGPQLGD
jgi:CMP-N-acetylneuraminic acid synthetase